MDPFNIPIYLSGRALLPGEAHPIQIGVPFPKGALLQLNPLQLFCGDQEIPSDITPLMSWPDGSCKWALLRFLARSETGPMEYRLRLGNTEMTSAVGYGPKFSETDDAITVDTGRAVFTVAKDWLRPFTGIEIGGAQILAPASDPVSLYDAAGKSHRFRIQTCRVEHHGKVALELKLQGVLAAGRGSEFCRAVCRLAFFADTALVKMQCTLWNPKAARHRGGLWDLGDPGSIFFRSFAVPFSFQNAAAPQAWLALDPEAEAMPCRQACVHQNSSGNPSWQSLAHVDKDDRITVKFRGYRGALDNATFEGEQANPVVLIRHAAGVAAFAMEHFWQTFPSRIAVSESRVDLEPFPAADEQNFELQGGEKTTFTLWADFAADASHPAQALPAARSPLTPVLHPAWVATCGCLPHSAAPGLEDPFFTGMAQEWLDGKRSVSALRAAYEEFGWRNFGEVPADHEKLHYRGTREFISHYNNQYDLIHSFLRRFLETGDARWQALGSELCRHVINHDIYHTSSDKMAYNGGYFWHTAHYRHAGTATHRTYSRRGEDGPPPKHFGGGPSNEHNYTSGLWLHYCLTGDADSLEAVLELAAWVRGMQDGNRTPFRFLSRNPTGLATCTRSLDFQGPGRGGGYSINACLDAFAATGENTWLKQAEEFISICIHPEDDCGALDLLNHEDRWSYVVFLQVLGKYLDVKREREEYDAAFIYARSALIRYARWMADKEFPALWKPEQLEYPTSTWAAQDLRKTEVFLIAARYGDKFEENRFLERAEFFYAETKQTLARYDDRGSVRNMAILLHCLPAYQNRRSGAHCNLGFKTEAAQQFPAKTILIPQKIQAMRNAKSIAMTLGIAGLLRWLHYRRRASRRA